jgi:hypothetical protein
MTTFLMGEDTVSSLLDMTAESLGYEAYTGDVYVTPELSAAIESYEEALALALRECIATENVGASSGLSMDALVEALLGEGDASYAVFMTLRGEGVGIWDGRWERWFTDAEIKKIARCLKRSLGRLVDDTGGGALNDAFTNAVFETVPEDAEYVDNYRRNARGSGDPQAARELVLFIDNTNGLSLGSSHGQGKSVRENLLKKWDKGTYDFEKSVKLMGYLADAGAKQYVKEHGARTERWHETFNAPTRRLAARELAEQFQESAQEGAYSPNARVPGAPSAREKFLDAARRQGGLNRAQAERVLARYERDRLVKFDAVAGGFQLKHGAFMDRDVLRRAAGLDA